VISRSGVGIYTNCYTLTFTFTFTFTSTAKHYSFTVSLVHTYITLDDCSTRNITPQTHAGQLVFQSTRVGNRSYDRTTHTMQLDVPRTRRTLGDRAFAAAGPTLWNSLPHDITDCVSLTSFCGNLIFFVFYIIPLTTFFSGP